MRRVFFLKIHTILNTYNITFLTPKLFREGGGGLRPWNVPLRYYIHNLVFKNGTCSSWEEDVTDDLGWTTIRVIFYTCIAIIGHRVTQVT